MHISNAEIHKILELHLHKVSGVRSVPGSQRAHGPDQLSLSRKATDMQEVKQLLTRLPDIRVGVVKDFKNRVQAGVYEVSEVDIAENMLASAMENRAAV